MTGKRYGVSAYLAPSLYVRPKLWEERLPEMFASSLGAIGVSAFSVSEPEHHPEWIDQETGEVHPEHYEVWAEGERDT